MNIFTPVFSNHSKLFILIIFQNNHSPTPHFSSRSEESYKTYTDTMPWLRIPFNQEDRRQKLARALDVQAIPTLVILDPRDNIITLEGRTEVLEDPEGLVSCFFTLFFFISGVRVIQLLLVLLLRAQCSLEHARRRQILCIKYRSRRTALT